jgi:hypothetical protein
LVVGVIDLSNPSAVTAGVVAVVPVLLGAVTTWLKIFIDPQGEFRRRINLKRNDLLERVSLLHATLLNHSRRIDDDKLLRGDGHNEPDLVGDYAHRVFKLFAIFHRLEILKLVVKVAYWMLFTLIGLGILALLVNVLFDELRVVVLWYGVGAVVLELGLIAVVFAASQRLEQYEDVT